MTKPDDDLKKILFGEVTIDVAYVYEMCVYLYMYVYVHTCVCVCMHMHMRHMETSLPTALHFF
jgi:hypothetical protein